MCVCLIFPSTEYLMSFYIHILAGFATLALYISTQANRTLWKKRTLQTLLMLRGTVYIMVLWKPQCLHSNDYFRSRWQWVLMLFCIWWNHYLWFLYTINFAIVYWEHFRQSYTNEKYFFTILFKTVIWNSYVDEYCKSEVGCLCGKPL